MLATVKDWHQTLSWKLGYGRGEEGRAYSCPWWVDEQVYALAFMQVRSFPIGLNQKGLESLQASGRLRVNRYIKTAHGPRRTS
jgi:hypothetical protein